jgi:hypothetical protein
MLTQFGIEDERVRLDWVSASEGDRFAAIVKDMTEQIKRLGPFGAKGDYDIVNEPKKEGQLEHSTNIDGGSNG